jgi:hypothetical protein
MDAGRQPMDENCHFVVEKGHRSPGSGAENGLLVGLARNLHVSQ